MVTEYKNILILFSDCLDRNIHFKKNIRSRVSVLLTPIWVFVYINLVAIG